MLALFAFAPPVPQIETYRIDGVDRRALVFPGEGAAPKAGRPLILAFHGHGGGMFQASRSFALQTHWPEAIVVYPDGLPSRGLNDPQGTRKGWQQNAGESEDRDLKLVDRILETTKGFDPHRVYAMGHSNGGRFTYVLWATRDRRFAAYGPSGSPALTFDLKPASAFLVAGETDPLISFGVQKATLDRLARLDGIDLTKGLKTGYVTLASAPSGLELGAYLHPGGHTYPKEAARETVEFFKRHARKD